MHGSMYSTAENRRGKKNKEKKKKPQLQNIMSASATQGGHNNPTVWVCQYVVTFFPETLKFFPFGEFSLVGNSTSYAYWPTGRRRMCAGNWRSRMNAVAMLMFALDTVGQWDRYVCYNAHSTLLCYTLWWSAINDSRSCSLVGALCRFVNI